jgi:fructose-1,6-bisphosphatase/inositol monophosphatase family enzyme
MNKNLQNFIFSTFEELFSFMQPYLYNYQKFTERISSEVVVKAGGNVQYNFDIELDKIIRAKIKQFKITGKIYSEEGGFWEEGDKKYRVVYDPFCNSSLMAKTFHEGAVGISFFDYEYNFITSAIMDYHSGLLGVVEDDQSNFYQVQNKKRLRISKTEHELLKNSLTVISLRKVKERVHYEKTDYILKNCNRLVIGSGHIYWLKLATGYIDAYLDPFDGEPLYEMFASALAQKAGCTLTDLDGNSFNPSKSLQIFEQDQSYRFCPVAATNERLHHEILDSIR